MADEQNLAESYFAFKELFSSSSIVFYQASLEDSQPLTFVSQSVTGLLGFTPDEFLSGDSLWRSRLHPEDKSRVLDQFSKISAIGFFVIEYRFRHKNGHYLWLRDEVKLIKDNYGSPQSIVGCSLSITSRKETENKLRNLNETLEQRISERTKDLTVANRKLKKQFQYHNKAKLKLNEQQKKLKLLEMAIANINDMVIISEGPANDPMQSEIIYVNKAFEQITGYSFSEVKHERPVFLHGEDTSTKVLSYVEGRINQHKPLRVEFINYKKDGSKFWVELDMAPFPSDEKGKEYWVGINRDITLRKKAELTLEENEHRYRAYSDLSFDAIFEITQNGIITDCNRRACEMFGYSKDELIGTNTIELIPDKYKDGLPKFLSQQVATGNAAWQRIYKKKDGTLFPTEISTKFYKRGGQTHLIAYVRDISEQKEYEEAIERSLKEKETLLAEIHHRVKNNLAIISGLLEIQTFNAEDDKIVKELRESQSRIQSIAMVHEKLYQSESFTDIALDSYIEELLSLIANTFGQEKQHIEIKKNIDPIFLDVTQAIPCGLILNELITNAYKHAFKKATKGVLEISLKQQASLITIVVKDSGPGFPDGFDFGSSSSLGTTLVKTLVKQLQGSLDASSGEGACFTISFEIEN